MTETLNEYCKRTEQEKRELSQRIAQMECSAFEQEKMITGMKQSVDTYRNERDRVITKLNSASHTIADLKKERAILGDENKRQKKKNEEQFNAMLGLVKERDDAIARATQAEHDVGRLKEKLSRCYQAHGLDVMAEECKTLKERLKSETGILTGRFEMLTQQVTERDLRIRYQDLCIKQLETEIIRLNQIMKEKDKEIASQKLTIEAQAEAIRMWCEDEKERMAKHNPVYTITFTSNGEIKKPCNACRFFPLLKQPGCPLQCMMCKDRSHWEPTSK